MDIFITKYALSSGIKVRSDLSISNEGYASNARLSVFLGKNDYATSPEAALADAERRRAAKIASLRKQIAKLEKLTFTVPVASPAEPA